MLGFVVLLSVPLIVASDEGARPSWRTVLVAAALYGAWVRGHVVDIERGEA